MTPRKSSTGFLHLPCELRLMIYYHYIPHKCEVHLEIRPYIGARWITSTDNAYLVQHPFHNILRVSKQVSEEALDNLYDENTFVYTTWVTEESFRRERRDDPWVPMFTDENKARIGFQQYQISCSGVLYGGACDPEDGYCEINHTDKCDVRMYWDIDMTIYPGSIRLSVDVVDDDWGVYDTRVVPDLLWETMFEMLGLIVEKTVPPQLTSDEASTEVFVTSHLLRDEQMMHCLRRLFDSYLYRGYQIHEAS